MILRPREIAFASTLLLLTPGGLHLAVRALRFQPSGRGMESRRPSDDTSFGTFVLQRTLPPPSQPPGQPQPRLRIAYRIVRPSLLSDPERAPIIVIHGGPSLPSEYIVPLAKHLEKRAVVFYDQLGCGWSSIPQEDGWYGVPEMSRDLEELVAHLRRARGVERFHLLGHSLGGAIGYEYLKRGAAEGGQGGGAGGEAPRCLSFILSNASTDFRLSSSEQARMFHEFQLGHLQTRMPAPGSGSGRGARGKEPSMQDLFFRAHVCRAPERPAELASALSRRGKDWSAMEYSATAAVGADAPATLLPTALVIRGRHDFVTEACTRGWGDLLAPLSRSAVEEVVLDGCAHYPHFERPAEYSSAIEKFCSMAESGSSLEEAV